MIREKGEIARMIKDYEIAILVRMYDKKILRHRGYRNLQMVRRAIRWDEIALRYCVKKNFKSAVRKLVKRKLLDDQGKSCKVCSLDVFGIGFVESLSNEGRREYL